MSDRIGRSDAKARRSTPAKTRILRSTKSKRRKNVHPRLYRLIETHQKIDAALRREQSRPGPNGFRMMRLKKLKLRVKDLIHRFIGKPARI